MSKRLEIVHDKAPITAQDAATYQNFGKVLQAHKAASLVVNLKWIGGIGGGVATTTVVTILALPTAEPEMQVDLLEPAEDSIEMVMVEPIPAQPILTDIEPLIYQAPAIRELAALPTVEEETSLPLEEEPEASDELAESDAVDTPEEESTPAEPATFVQAEPLKGFPALYSFLAENTMYPPKAVADSVEGIVLVGFQIDEKGNINSVRVLESLHPLLDHEATRVIRSMGAWKPALYGDTPVRSNLAIPITFQVIKPTPPKQ